MPHFGLMDPGMLSPEDAALTRARLHIRAGKRRLREGKIAAGVVTLWDAFTHAMEWYLLGTSRKKNLKILGDDNLNDEKNLFSVLKRSGVIDGAFDFRDFSEPFDRALEEGDHGTMPGFDYALYTGRIEAFMLHLGVMPFDERLLPPEDPATF